VVDLLIVLEGDGRARVIHGNYDTYERMRALQTDGEFERAKKANAESIATSVTAAIPETKLKRKRRFPYRKVADLEADIAAAETKLRQLEQLMASPDLYRDGDKVKETTRSFEETKSRLQQLYEHWEEAVELN